MSTHIKTLQRKRRQKRIRARISGTSEKPRVSVYRSSRDMFIQVIDDTKGVTIASLKTSSFKDKPRNDAAFEVGKALAEKMKEKKVTEAVFDRGGYIYTGVVARVADGLREGGIKM